MMPGIYPVLYSFRRCPYAMRARMALLVSGQVCELREVVLSRKPEALLQASAKGTVPVLVDVNGTVVAQSMDIMLWALNRNDPEKWLQPNGKTLALMLQMIARCDGEFKHHLDRYKYLNRFDSANHIESRTKGAVFLSELNQGLQGHSHLLSESQSLADVAIAPFVRQFAHTDPDWFASQPWLALQNWLEKFENSALFANSMHKYSAWTPDQKALLFPEPTKEPNLTS